MLCQASCTMQSYADAGLGLQILQQLGGINTVMVSSPADPPPPSPPPPACMLTLLGANKHGLALYFIHVTTSKSHVTVSDQKHRTDIVAYSQ